MNKEQFEKIMQWKLETFPSATALSELKHLAGPEPGGEILELMNDLESDGPEKNLELADCFLLLYGIAKRMGLEYDDIGKIIDQKMEINYQREWNDPDQNGIQTHVKK